MVRLTDPLGQVAAFGYDAIGRQTTLTDATVRTTGDQPVLLETRAYTDNGPLESVANANGNAVSFAYDGFDRLATTTHPGGSNAQLTYDADSNVLTAKDRAGDTTSFVYDTLNRLTTLTPPNSEPVISYRYDQAGRVTTVSDTSAAIVAAVPPSGGLASYTTNTAYDALDRPKTMSLDEVATPAQTTLSGATFTHTYDAIDRGVGQTTTDDGFWDVPASAASVSYTANDLDQYTAVGGVTYTHDANGNLEDDGTFTFDYDSRNRLTAVNDNVPAMVASYSYDANGSRKTATAGGNTTVFVTDADSRVVLTYDGSTGALQKRLVYGLGIDDAAMVIDVPTGTRDSLIPNIQGSVIGSLASDTATLTKIGYRPYGLSATATPGIRYTGRRLDALTGLYHYRARAYSPGLGRFLQPDPIGIVDGNNLYAYVRNDPLNFVDPNGEFAQLIFGALIGGGADLGAQIYSGIQSGQSFSEAFGNANFKSVAASAAIGAVTGGASALGKAAVTGTISVIPKVVIATGVPASGRVALGLNAVALGGLAKVSADHQVSQRTGGEINSIQSAIGGAAKSFVPFGDKIVDFFATDSISQNRSKSVEGGGKIGTTNSVK